MPSGFCGEKKSFTLPGPTDTCSSIGILWAPEFKKQKGKTINTEARSKTTRHIRYPAHKSPASRWFSDQLYVADTKKQLDGYNVNSSGGTTVSCKKRGGWPNAWLAAQQMAGWV